MRCKEIFVYESGDSPGLSRTDIEILSPVWTCMGRVFLGPGLVECWSDDGLVWEQNEVGMYLMGWSLRYGMSELYCAQVAVLSGLQVGKRGYLIWDHNGGIHISCAACSDEEHLRLVPLSLQQRFVRFDRDCVESMVPAMFVPSLLQLPKEVQSVTGRSLII